MPIIPFGTGSSLEGHLNAPYGGVSVDVSRMNRIVAVHAEDLDCVVEPGVTRKQLNEYLRDQGLFFPIDPGADASLGGMASTRASGTNAVRYGTMKDNVLNVTAVMPDGTRIKTASRAKKTSAGYDLTRLLIGSEGTLGIITELTLRLQGIPQAMSAAVCSFPDVESACRAVIATIQYGIPMARIELLDELQVQRLQRAFASRSSGDARCLLLEFHGTPAGVEEQAQEFGAIAEEFGGGGFRFETREEDRQKLWQARHDAYFAVQGRCGPGVDVFATDVCVPISRLADCVMETKADLERLGITGADRRPCRRRQLSSERAGRHAEPGGDARGGGAGRAARQARHRHGRHLHGRARCRPGQDGLSGGRAGGGARRDAGDQGGDRSAQHHESR